MSIVLELPSPLTPLIGREREIATVLTLLHDDTTRLVTLTGPGGAGKTRLAVQIGTLLRDQGERAVTFVSLAAITDPGLVPVAIARTLGIRETGEQSLLEQLRLALRAWDGLLILDNFEQVIGAATLLVDLLSRCPRLQILVTSRAVLRISGEQEFVVPSLTLPTGSSTLAEASTSEAVALFLQRAEAARARFVMTPDNAETIVEICRRLDGLPLALELAAARLKVLSPAALLARLSHRLQLLTSGPQDQPGRLQTMRAAIAWSHDLLSDDERRLFRQLSVFAGGFTLEAAEAVCGSRESGVGSRELDDRFPVAPDFHLPTPDFVLDGVASLVDKSLVRREDEAEQPRFGMLETIREFAGEQRETAGESLEVSRRHAAFFLALAREAEPHLYGSEQSRWFDRLQQDHPNVRAALAWSIEQGDAETCLGLAAAIWPFWFTRGYLSEGRTWLERVLAVPGIAFSRSWVEAVHGLGALAHQIGDYQGTLAAGEKLAGTARQHASEWGVARGLYMMSRGVGALGDRARSAALADEAVRAFDALGDRLWLAYALHRLGVEVAGLGEPKRAARHFEEALSLWRTLGNIAGTAMSLDSLAEVAGTAGDTHRAAEALRESLALYWELGDPVGTVEALVTLVTQLLSIGRNRDIARLLGAADAMRETLGYTFYAHHRAAIDRAIPVLRAAIGEDAFADAWAAGRGLSGQDVIAEALALAAEATTVREVPHASSTRGLSAREIEVVRLIVVGYSDREIAEALFISVRTAQKHVANILTKLDVGTRTAAVSVALRAGIV